MTVHVQAQKVLDFWFSEQIQPFWFKKNNDFDTKIRLQFQTIWQQAVQGECVVWRTTLLGRLAEVIVLDQFSRNLYRNSALAFAQDGMALVLAQEAVQHIGFATLSLKQRNMLLMPWMHSESLAIHTQAIALFERYADSNTLEFELKHKAIIDRFGRYPHRNAILGRACTVEEMAFLQEPNSSF